MQRVLVVVSGATDLKEENEEEDENEAKNEVTMRQRKVRNFDVIFVFSFNLVCRKN